MRKEQHAVTFTEGRVTGKVSSVNAKTGVKMIVIQMVHVVLPYNRSVQRSYFSIAYAVQSGNLWPASVLCIEKADRRAWRSASRLPVGVHQFAEEELMDVTVS